MKLHGFIMGNVGQTLFFVFFVKKNFVLLLHLVKDKMLFGKHKEKYEKICAGWTLTTNFSLTKEKETASSTPLSFLTG